MVDNPKIVEEIKNTVEPYLKEKTTFERKGSKKVFKSFAEVKEYLSGTDEK